MRETFEDEIFYRIRDGVSMELFGPFAQAEGLKAVDKLRRRGRLVALEKLAFPAWVLDADQVRYVIVAEDRLNELLRHEQAFRQAGLQISIEEESEARRS